MLFVLKGSIAALLFAMGMCATLEDARCLWRRPGLLLKSLVALYVLAPAAALAMARGLHLPWGTEVAPVVLALCAGAPLLPKKLLRFGGEPTYAFSLVIATSLLAIATVPGGLHLAREHLSSDSSVTASGVAYIILVSFLVPLGTGMLLSAAAPALSEKLGEPLLKLAGAALGLSALGKLVLGWRLLLDVGAPCYLAFGAFSLVALAAGHALGGPDGRERTSLAVASAIVSIPYIQWRKKVNSQEIPLAA
jgi:predicted Na+-dependent transporter